MDKSEFLLKYIGHYKYPLIIIIGVLVIGVFSESSILTFIRLTNQRNELKQELETQKHDDEKARQELRSLTSSGNMVEKVARERYFMKKDNEDIFVLSTDIPEEETNGKFKTGN